MKWIGTNITNELLIVYTLIGVVIFLMIVLLLVDHFGKKKKDSLFDSKKLSKRLQALEEAEEKMEDSISTFTQEPLSEEIIPIPETPIVEETLEMDIEKESDLEKTQAQIEVEEITRALKKAQEEENRVDPYAKFEEEQEQSAIISYDELHEKFDQLYDENEKIQYVDDDSLPINMNELYEKNEEILHPKKVTLDDLHTVSTSKETDPKSTTTTSGFKSSPVISPVYGIQKEENHNYQGTNVRELDDEIRKTNEFLKNLKELQKNLDS